jgi:hypothetical protein
LFTAIAEAAAARKTAIALIIDEMQYLSEKEFAALITAIHLVGQKSLPLFLIGAGLPQLVGLAGKAKSYAERLFSYPKIGRLSDEEARDALCHPVQEQGVEYEDKVIEEISAREVKGLISLPSQGRFHQGENVRLADGPFAGYIGIHAGMRDAERARVLIELLGRSTLVEVDEGTLQSVAIGIVK